MNDPVAHWRILTQLVLTIPAAVLGDAIWEKTGGVQSAAKEESKKLTKEERPDY